ncbi:hypothetical protein M758_3G124900 [Ceratodon purpureus]|nr:hypothetical protein M758_3G124900 [Ceratodon purpureus]
MGKDITKTSPGPLTTQSPKHQTPSNKNATNATLSLQQCYIRAVLTELKQNKAHEAKPRNYANRS